MSYNHDILTREGKEICFFPMENKPNGWYVKVGLDDLSYLHKDLVVRNSTQHNGEYKGYFETKSEAIQAIEEYYNSPPLADM